MRRFSKLALGVAVVAAGLLLVGCGSTSATTPTASAAGSEPLKGVTCNKCEITYVKVPIEGGKGKVAGYTTRKDMECPDCRSVAENFFATGKLEHTCKTCGDAVEVCEGH